MSTNALILGRSQYGKSSLAKALAKKFKEAGRRVLVYDILLDDWNADYVTDDKDEFFKIFWGSFDLVAFIEEGGETANKKETEMVYTATRGRHQVGAQGFGNCCYYSCHRLNQLDVTLRAQCPELFLFASRYDDARDLCQEYGERELLKAPTLPPGHFYHVSPGQPALIWKIDFKTLKIERHYAR
jgi:hypothetical protein